MFIDPSTQDPIGDATLESMAEGGQGRFVFASSRRHSDFDRDATLRAAAAPGAFPLLTGAARPGPRVALVLPYGEAMTRYSGLSNVTRNEDGVLRDVHLRERHGRLGACLLCRSGLRPTQTAGRFHRSHRRCA